MNTSNPSNRLQTAASSDAVIWPLWYALSASASSWNSALLNRSKAARITACRSSRGAAGRVFFSSFLRRWLMLTTVAFQCSEPLFEIHGLDCPPLDLQHARD